jgi:hypothetical protein
MQSVIGARQVCHAQATGASLGCVVPSQLTWKLVGPHGLVVVVMGGFGLDQSRRKHGKNPLCSPGVQRDAL